MLIRLMVMLLASGMFAGAFAVGRALFLRLLFRESPRPSVHSAVPEAWRSILRSRVPLSSRLTPGQRERLLYKMQQLVLGCRWEGCGGLQLTEEMQVIIAAHACLLVLEHPGEPYPTLRNILVYPGTFQPRRFSWTPSADSEPEDPALGESWRQGVVILAWESAREGASDPTDGHNVMLHEFAHQLDASSGDHDGIPRLPDATALSSWTGMLESGFEQLLREAEAGTVGVLDHYGATNHAEFFAVATEAFFEKPTELRQARPELYAALHSYYGQDPAGPVGVTDEKADPADGTHA